MQTKRRVAANPQTKPTDLGCESADKWLLPSTSTVVICYYYSARKLMLILLILGDEPVEWRHYRWPEGYFVCGKPYHMQLTHCFL